MNLRKCSFALVALVAIGFGLALVQAQEEENPEIGYRQRLMKGQGASMGSIGDIMKYRMPNAGKHVEAHAKNIANYSSLIVEAFEKELTEGKTDAKPGIWQNWDDFVAKANALNAAGNDLAMAAAGGDTRAMMPKVKALGDACRGCHNEYRKPEEERFPR